MISVSKNYLDKRCFAEERGYKVYKNLYNWYVVEFRGKYLYSHWDWKEFFNFIIKL